MLRMVPLPRTLRYGRGLPTARVAESAPSPTHGVERGRNNQQPQGVALSQFGQPAVIGLTELMVNRV